MKNGLVSVIIPTRNRAAYLKQAIDSVYAQSYQNFEILVIDDGSGDNTRDIIKSFDERLQYFFQEHAGTSAARNNGISKAQGEYIAFLDDDDIFVPEKLETCINYLLNNPEVIWVCSGFSFIDADGRPLPRNAIIPEKTVVTLHDIAMFTFIDTSTVVVRKKIFEVVGRFTETSTVSEDYHMWARIIATGKGAALQKCLAYFRLHAGNTKLPYQALLKENTRIIDYIIATKSPDLTSRETYIKNLHRIISDSLLYKKKFLQYVSFHIRRVLFLTE